MTLSSPIRVLHIGTFQKSKGGVESFIMNVYRHIDRSNIQFDFLIGGPEDRCSYKNEIESLGGKIYSRLSRRKHPIRSVLRLCSFFKNHREYSIVHLHGCTASYLDPLIIAQKYGVSTRILHSHNTQHGGNPLIFKPIITLNRIFFHSCYNYSFACSHEAGKWMFQNNPYQIILNGIEVERFAFCNSTRNIYRKELDIEQSFVVGHIGRFAKQKNHVFLCEVFAEIYKKNNKAILLLVGIGELEKQIKHLVKKMGLSHAVRFLGVREDVAQLYQAMDLFLFPSIYEGLGIVLVEAQSSGLPCITSDVIPQSAKVSDSIEFISLRKSPAYWATQCLKYADIKPNRTKNFGDIVLGEYNIKSTAKKLEKFYLRECKVS